VRVPTEWLEHVYEPWFGEAPLEPELTSLLAICFGVVRERRGWLELEQPAEGGTTFRVHWPLD
jgi:C4-dicarboxylate-specific signal transduction histidine kinase